MKVKKLNKFKKATSKVAFLFAGAIVLSPCITSLQSCSTTNEVISSEIITSSRLNEVKTARSNKTMKQANRNNNNSIFNNSVNKRIYFDNTSNDIEFVETLYYYRNRPTGFSRYEYLKVSLSWYYDYDHDTISILTLRNESYSLVYDDYNDSTYTIPSDIFADILDGDIAMLGISAVFDDSGTLDESYIFYEDSNADLVYDTDYPIYGLDEGLAFESLNNGYGSTFYFSYSFENMFNDCDAIRMMVDDYYDEGYDNGYDEGYDDGDTNGYNQGLSDGYDEGYGDGVLDNSSYIGPLANLPLEYGLYNIDTDEFDYSREVFINNTATQNLELLNGGFKIISWEDFEDLFNSGEIDNSDYAFTMIIPFGSNGVRIENINKLFPINNDNVPYLDFGQQITISTTTNTYTWDGNDDYSLQYIDFESFQNGILKNSLITSIRFSGISADYIPYGLMTNNDYSVGYDKGYDLGFTSGRLDGIDVGYENGFDDGKIAAGTTYSDGYTKGYNDAKNQYQNVEALSFEDVLSAVITAPNKIIREGFDFDILGINVGSLIQTCVVIGLIVFSIGLFKKG